MGDQKKNYRDEIGKLQHRTFVQRGLTIDKEARTVPLAFASETGVERWFGKEILSCAPGAVMLDRLNSGGPLLSDHNSRGQVGAIVRNSATVDADKVCRATVKFSKRQAGEDEFQDVQDEIRTCVSVGYMVHEYTVDNDEETYTATRWEPVEISIVSMPADTSVGVGRAFEEANERRAGNEKVPLGENQETDDEARESRERNQTPIEVRNMADEKKDTTTISEVARATEIMDLAKVIDAPGETLAQEVARDAISGGKTIAEFRQMVFDKRQARQAENKTYLDETFNNILPNGNRVLMSIEVDNDDQVVAYYLTTPYYDYLYPEHGRVRHRVRVPAEEIIYVGVFHDDESVTRCAPWTHAAMRNLREMGAYIEAKVVGARVEACQMAMLVPPRDDGDEVDLDLQVEVEAQPGIFPVLPPGYEVKTFDPKHPNGQEGEFLKAMLKGVAVGFDVDYCTFASDLREVNFSSIRAGINEVREVWKSSQQFFIEHFHRQVYLAWLRSCMMTGVIEGVLPRDYERLNEPKFLPRGWGYVNPLQDVQADEARVSNGFTTRTAVAADDGEDFEEILITLAEEKKLADKYGIEFKASKAPLNAGEPVNPQPQPDDES